MTWQPGQPVQTDADHADWKHGGVQASWKDSARGAGNIDGSTTTRAKEAQAVIDARAGPFAEGSHSSVIDRLILATVGELPE